MQSLLSEGSEKILNAKVQLAMGEGRQCSIMVSNQVYTYLFTPSVIIQYTCMTLCVMSVLSEVPNPPMH